uniref:Uncharacterized protein n=1 Tax=Anguilla anguilla TaxID=7936 RepID=A0A0E9U2Z9_ANGAN
MLKYVSRSLSCSAFETDTCSGKVFHFPVVGCCQDICCTSTLEL